MEPESCSNVDCSRLRMSSTPCACCGGVSSCNTDDYRKRVLYHSGRFQGKCRKDVLERYERQRHEMDVLQLQKFTFHVASWIAELPPAEMSQRNGELSGVTLLVDYLQSLKEASVPLCQQLTKVLQDVFVISETEQWMTLSRILILLLPELVKQLVDPELPMPCRKLTKDIQVWRNATTNDSQESYVSELEQALEQSDGSQLHRIFRAAVAALSPPRLWAIADQDNESLLDAEAKSDFQRRLRRVVLGCLDQLDLADPKVKPALQMLELLINRFQELVGQEQMVASRRHWVQLETKCGMAVTLNGPKAERKRKHCEHGVRQENCKHCNKCPCGRTRRNHCPQCNACPHGKIKYWCAVCTPKASCPHGKLKKHCKECAGCPHGKLKQNCRDCTGCPHGKLKQECRECTGCPHGKLKYKCSECKGCPHGKLKYNCRECNGCPHGKVKQQCRKCTGCPHDKLKYKCRECTGCPHGKLKRFCLLCSKTGPRQSFDEYGATS